MDELRKENIKSAFIRSQMESGFGLTHELYGTTVYAYLAGYAPDISIADAYKIVSELRDYYDRKCDNDE